METMSFTKLDNASLKTTPFEDVGMMPKVKKSAIRMTVFDDGTSDWTIKDLEPSNKIVYPDKSPPDKRAKTVLTRIDRSGLARFFDKDNNEKHKYQMTMPSMKDFVSILRGDTSDVGKSLVGNSILASRGGVNVNQLLENAARNGATIKSVSKNVISITLGGTLMSSVQALDDPKVTEIVVDTAQRIMLASSIKTSQGQDVSHIFMKYKSGAATPTLELMEQRTYDLNSPADHRTVSIMNTFFSNMQVTVH